jgi:hypothetical protein
MECLLQNRGISTVTTTTTTTASWGTRISSLGHGRVKVTAVHAILGAPDKKAVIARIRIKRFSSLKFDVRTTERTGTNGNFNRNGNFLGRGKIGGNIYSTKCQKHKTAVIHLAHCSSMFRARTCNFSLRSVLTGNTKME